MVKSRTIERDTEEWDFKEIIRKGKYKAGFMLLYDEDGIHAFMRWRDSNGRKRLTPLLNLLKERFGFKTDKRKKQNED